MTESPVIRDELNQLRRDVRPGSIWRHKKGGLYMTTGVAWDTEHDWPVVNYFRIGGPNYNEQDEAGIIFSRPAYMWKPDRFVQENPFSAR